MNTACFKAHRVFIIPLLIAAAHFILTSVVGHYIAVQVGTQVGQVVAGGLIETYEKKLQPASKSEEGKRIYQDMKNKSEDIVENSKIPVLLISLPVKPLMNPSLENIREAQIKMVLSKKISKEQFYIRGIMIDYAANLVNSFSVGLLVYVILRVSKRCKMKT